MPETNIDSAAKKLVVVTGANKGIGLEICHQLATIGFIVVLTARDEKRGVEAVEKLKGSGLSNVVFHQLDVMDPASVASLADFIKQFGKLDILVNNAGINGIKLDDDAYRVLMAVDDPPEVRFIKYRELARETPEMAEECVQANYYGAKRVTEALLPLLQLSDSPRIVNVSSSGGKLQNALLQYVTDTWAKEVRSDEDGLTEERVDEVLNKFLKDFKETHGWPAYTMSKAAMNAYTRILARMLPKFRINCVCPGYVKTDINYNTGVCTVEEGAAGPVKLALLPDDGPSGLFFFQKEVSNF
ncbi:salutaridine reductase-like isoform X1 [Macadamia integrifolia]|uniref:salutaridine reductase-like isoform X1 n=1 Tax=Macadamia integrifolia TaxID=60698 RepID=UPI001C4EB98E|nr:salutaridine reductase-like isoform X1 [Macadamia integrifolia]